MKNICKLFIILVTMSCDVMVLAQEEARQNDVGPKEAQIEMPHLAPVKNNGQQLGLGNMAVVKPNVPADMDEESMNDLWQCLEREASKLKVFTIIARSDKVFRNTINEISFQGTHLTAKGGERVRPNQIKGVRTLLCCSVGKYEGVWTLNMYLIDAESMTIRSEFTAGGDFNSYRTLKNRMGAYVKKLFNRFEIMDVMLVNPVFPEKADVNGEAFTNELLKNGVFEKVTMRSEHELGPLLKEMGKTARAELMADDWERFHNILAARFLVEPRFTRFSMVEDVTKPNPYNGEKNSFCVFEAEGYIKVTDATNGQPVVTIELNPHKKRNSELGPVDGKPDVFKHNYPSRALAEMAAAVAPALTDALLEKLGQEKGE